MALSPWLGLFCHPNNHRNDFEMKLESFDMCLSGWRVEGSVEDDGWCLESQKMTQIFTELNVFQACSDAAVTMIIDSSASASLHCFFCLFQKYSPDWLPTGCFLGCHCTIWGADLHSRSVSWHDRFHSECYEWPPSNPGGETWEREIQKHTLLVMYFIQCIWDREASALLCFLKKHISDPFGLL